MITLSRSIFKVKYDPSKKILSTNFFTFADLKYNLYPVFMKQQVRLLLAEQNTESRVERYRMLGMKSTAPDYFFGKIHFTESEISYCL